MLIMHTGYTVAAAEADLLVTFRPTPEGVIIVAEAEAPELLEASAEVLIRRTGPTGSMTSKQSVEVSLLPGHKQVLAVFSTNLPADHTIEVSATLRSGGQLMKEVTASYP